MLSAVARLLRPVVHGLVRGNGLRPLAAGFALGLVVTFAPQGHLISVSLCVLLFSLRVKGDGDLTAAESGRSPAQPHEESFSCVA